MKTTFAKFLLVLFVCLPVLASAQIVALPDSICVVLGQSISYNVTDNDSIPPSPPPPPSNVINVFWLQPSSSCINLSNKGELSFSPTADCCGQTLKYTYRYENCETCSAIVTIMVKCPKPDCFFVNMEDFIRPDSGSTNPTCALACEHSVSTYFATYNPASTYDWTVTGGTYTPGPNAAAILVTWGNNGPGLVTLTITNGGVATTIKACANILAGPVASFTPSATQVCLHSGAISFQNTSTDASGSFWDFGDGSTSAMSNATHVYTTPGIHRVCLYVTRNNYDDEGNALCCCMDTACVDIFVDSLAGPNIYCVSTLCAHDSTRYWTDARHCGSYTWKVLDENGSPLAFSGQNTGEIFVQWGGGPVGTVTLEVENCDSVYCDRPVSVSVPIIPASLAVGGATLVCENASVTYTVPKWVGVYYDWEVTGAISWTGDGTHTITVRWGAAGTGTITLKYYSDFLGGLPGQDPAGCMGTGLLTVVIKPRFQIIPPQKLVVCAGDVSTYFATSFPSGSFHWTISGTPAPSFTGQNTDAITVTWDAGPGTFAVTATPNDPTAYCNAVATQFMQVLEVPPPAIDGPQDICPLGTYTYFAQSPQPGVGYKWTVTNGAALSGTTGNLVTVGWGLSGPFILSLQQFLLAAPQCSSEVIIDTMVVKPLFVPAISGPSSACINSIQHYTAGPNQPPGTNYVWTLVDTLMGSIISGQGTSAIDVQWNGTPGGALLLLNVDRCIQSKLAFISVTLQAPVIPVIMQNDTLCPNESFVLDAGTGFSSYLWKPSGATTQTIGASTVGNYTVMTTDQNGCMASSGSFLAAALPGAPSAPPEYFLICNETSVTLTAPICACTYAWTCNTLPVGGGTPSAFLIHSNTFTNGTFNYEVTVTDANGCTAISKFTVTETDICGMGCTPDALATLSFTPVNQLPNCNTVHFTAAFSNAVLAGWNFGDPYGNNNAGNLANAVHTYTKVGDYAVSLYAKTGNSNPPPDSCALMYSDSVHIPLAADFSYVANCATVTFTDQSKFLPNAAPPLGWTWAWSFGDLGTSTAQNPVHLYLNPGFYMVTLTVTNAAGCQSTFINAVLAGGAPSPGITAVPDSVCVGQTVSFTGSGVDVVQWNWTFGDGSGNGSQHPLHSYLSAGTFHPILTVTNAEGCKNQDTLVVVVSPLPVDSVISVTPKPIICAGMTATLTAPYGTGNFTYQWSDSVHSTTQTITVAQAGTYTVTVTDAHGCTMVPDSVTVVVVPVPPASISGNPYICDGGCTTLSAPNGQNYTYQWLPTFETSQRISVCKGSIQAPYSVTVTDPVYGCSAEAGPFNVRDTVPPMFGIAVGPNACAGMADMLTITGVQPNVVYSWNNGASGPAIIVSQAGNSIAFGRDTITGCINSASTIIHPLPDLCLVPVGCYETCNPDTICAPAGLTAYQWNENGVPITGANNPCLIVSHSGTYSLTGVNEFGCFLTTDTLMLKVVDCSCFDLTASAIPSGNSGCCWKLSYHNPLPNLYGLVIHSSDADLSFNGLNALGLDFMNTQAIGLTNLLGSTVPLPSGALNDFVTLCLNNVQHSPQRLIFDWYDLDSMIVCSDTVELHSEHFLSDTISLCPGKTVMLGGAAYSAPATVMLTLPGMGGECDTLATYQLVLAPVHTVSFNCPPDITVDAGLNGDSAVVQFPVPSATSTCPGSIPVVTQIAGPPSGSAFPVGDTQVCFLAKDSDDCCSKVDTCCFQVTVNEKEDLCDEAVIDCIRFELFGITKDAVGNLTYRIRVTNNCLTPLTYVTFQLPDGIIANNPSDNSLYTAPSGRQYVVRNPNFSPFYSLRFKSLAGGISNGQSEIFQYILPPQVCHGCVLAFLRLNPQISYQAHLCCVMPDNLVASPANPAPHLLHQRESEEKKAGKSNPANNAPDRRFTLFPNPTTGTVFADLSDWEGERLQILVLNSQGQRVQSITTIATDIIEQIQLAADLPVGLYFLEILTEKGERQNARFVVQH